MTAIVKDLPLAAAEMRPKKNDARIKGAKASIADLTGISIIILGIVLTGVWCAGIAWLLMRALNIV